MGPYREERLNAARARTGGDVGVTEHGITDHGDGARHAVVLSGGGARGAYEIGVLQALFAGECPATAGRPLQSRIFSGTSVGAFNAAFLAQQANADAEAIDRLTRIWRGRIADTLGRCGNGVYRLRADPRRLVDPGCLRRPLELLGDLARDTLFWTGYAAVYGTQMLAADAPLRVRVLESFNLAALFSRGPLEALLADTIDLACLRTSPSALSVVATDWKHGRAIVFCKPDIVGRVGTDAILASAAVPGIFMPVEIDGSPFVDGALLMNTPLKPAIRDGADVLHVIYVDPTTGDLPFPDLPNTLDTFYRIYTILMATEINTDAMHIATIDEELAERAGRGAAPGNELPAVRAKRSIGLGRRGRERVREEKLYRPLVIHRYRPTAELGGAETFLDFSQPMIDRMIRQGYEDALSHDCRDAQCVLPPWAAPHRTGAPGELA